MKNCPRCNRQIDEQASFCSHCGTKINEYVTQNTAAPTMRLHCPRCKSTRLSAMTEAVGSVGRATRVSKRSAIAETTVHRQRSWTCHQCGHVFRNVDDLAAEYEAKYKSAIVLYILCFGGVALFALLLGILTSDMGTAFILILTMVAFCVGCCMLMKKWKAAKDKEVEKLRRDCFN